jgi:hypothetical protein
MEPSQLVFNTHISEASFQMCVDKGMWGLEGYDPSSSPWPFVIIWVSAGEKKNCPERYYFRFTLDGYPSLSPTACPWDNGTSSILEISKWPKGGTKTNIIFRTDWNGKALYVPCDRATRDPAHAYWETEYPNLWWRPEFKIDVYLNFLHKTLHASDYTHG